MLDQIVQGAAIICFCVIVVMIPFICIGHTLRENIHDESEKDLTLALSLIVIVLILFVFLGTDIFWRIE